MLLLGYQTPCGDPARGLALPRGARSCDGSGWRELAGADEPPRSLEGASPGAGGHGGVTDGAPQNHIAALLWFPRPAGSSPAG